MNSLLEAVGNHPWAAISAGAWLLGILALVGNVVKECVAIIATGERAPQPDLRSLAGPYPRVLGRPKRPVGRAKRTENGVDRERQSGA